VKVKYLKIGNLVLPLIFLLFINIVKSQDFITKWAFPTKSNTIRFGVETNGRVAYNWIASPSGKNGSGYFKWDPIVGGNIDLQFNINTDDTVILSMKPGSLRKIKFAEPLSELKLLAVIQWGSNPFQDMSNMFSGCRMLNITASDSPNLSNVINMSRMFSGASSFNADISNWNTSGIIDMEFMFADATSFNQDIGKWNTINVNKMAGMFYGTTSFNQDIGRWNTSKVITMEYMFYNASSFDQDIGKWNLNLNVNMENMLDSSGLDCFHYSATLNGWQSNNPTVKNRILGANGLKYGTNAEIARNTLVNSQGWTINGDSQSGKDCSTVGTHYEESKADLFLYPNPTSGILHIKNNNGSFYSISDLAGNVVVRGIIILNTVSLEFLQPGIYYLTVINSDSTKTNKVFKY
jgi:surface protein